LERYGLLKVSGKGEALKDAYKDLSARFAEGSRAAEPATTALHRRGLAFE
jgi:hypothetical protein